MVISLPILGSCRRGDRGRGHRQHVMKQKEEATISARSATFTGALNNCTNVCLDNGMLSSAPKTQN